MTSASAADGRMLRRVVSTPEHLGRGVGRQRLSFAEQREMARLENARQPHPSPQTGGHADATGDRTGQCEEVLHPRPDRARLRPSEDRFGLFIRTIGLARAQAKLTLANLAYNMDRLIFHERRAAMG